MAREIGRPLPTATIAASCSGDIQPGVPPSRSPTHSPGSIGLRARWKSRSIGWPSPAIRTFEGLTSMWTRPRAWAYCSASARHAAIQQIACTYVACSR